MNISELIKKVNEYNPSFMYKNGKVGLSMEVNKTWHIIEPKEEDKKKININYNNGKVVYTCSIDNEDLLCGYVNDTVSLNKELEKKVELYKTKVLELRELFLGDIPYEELVTMKFIYGKENKKKKNKKINKECVEQVDYGLDNELNNPIDGEIDRKIEEINIKTEVE